MKKAMAYYMIAFLLIDAIYIGVGFLMVGVGGVSKLNYDFMTPLGVVFAAFAISERSGKVKSIVSAFCMLYISFVFYIVYESLGYTVISISQWILQDSNNSNALAFNLLGFGFAINGAMLALSMGRIVWLLFRYSVEGTYVESETFLKRRLK